MSKVVQSKRSGFTLIELLVVIAIIAILAAILFPVFAKAREKARQTSCLSQTKQLGLAFFQYLDNYDEKLPSGTAAAAPVTAPTSSTAGTAGVPGNEGPGWAGQVYGQVKSASIFKCPDDATPLVGTFYPISYGFNSNAAGQTQGQFGNVAKSVMLFEIQGDAVDMTATGAASENASPASDGAGFQAVGTTGVNGATNASQAYATGQLAGSTFMVGTATGNTIATTGRHSDGSNFLMADGHSKWFRGSAVSPGVSNAIPSDCAPAGQGFTSGSGNTAPAGSAANSACSDGKLGATFSIN